MGDLDKLRSRDAIFNSAQETRGMADKAKEVAFERLAQKVHIFVPLIRDRKVIMTREGISLYSKPAGASLQ